MIEFAIDNLDLTQSGFAAAFKAGAFAAVLAFFLFTLYARVAFDWVFAGVPSVDRFHRWAAAIMILPAVVFFWDRQPAMSWLWLSLYFLPGFALVALSHRLLKARIMKWERGDPFKPWLASAGLALTEAPLYAWYFFFSMLNGSLFSVFNFYPFFGGPVAL